MLIISAADLDTITRTAEAAFPDECCGLLAGSETADGDHQVTRVVPSRNVTDGQAHDSFEVDPQVRFDLMRALDGTDERIIGHYHSHPGAAAEPSPRDVEKAYEPDLVWVIVSVIDGRAARTAAYLLAPNGGRFDEIGLRATRGRCP